MSMAVRYCKKYKPGLDVRKINAVFKLVAVGKMSDGSLVRAPWKKDGTVGPGQSKVFSLEV